MYPLLYLISRQPHLLVDHAQGYADLLAQETASASTVWKRKIVLYATALCCFGVAAVLTGVALMLWAVTPVIPVYAGWVLVAAPLAPMVLALWCLIVLRGQAVHSAFEQLHLQVKADLKMLHEATLP